MSTETSQQTRDRVGLSGFTGGRTCGRKKMETRKEEGMVKEGAIQMVVLYPQKT